MVIFLGAKYEYEGHAIDDTYISVLCWSRHTMIPLETTNGMKQKESNAIMNRILHVLQGLFLAEHNCAITRLLALAVLSLAARFRCFRSMTRP